MKPGRSKRYLEYVRSHSCCLCGRHEVQAHHLKVRGEVAMGRKVADYFSVPLCLQCHKDTHDRSISFEQRALMSESGFRLLVHWVEQEAL